MVMILERTPELKSLTSLRRTHDDRSRIRDELSMVDRSVREYSIPMNGAVYDFHRMGGGWVENGQDVRPGLYISKGVVLFVGTKVPSDAVSVHATEYGNAYGFEHYE